MGAGGGVISQNIFVSLGNWEILPRTCYVINQTVMVSLRQKRQQLRRAEVLARNRLAVKQPTTSKSCDMKSNSASQLNQMNLVRSIIRGVGGGGGGGSSTRTTWCKKRRKRNIVAENRKKKKNVIRVRLLL